MPLPKFDPTLFQYLSRLWSIILEIASSHPYIFNANQSVTYPRSASSGLHPVFFTGVNAIAAVKAPGATLWIVISVPAWPGPRKIFVAVVTWSKFTDLAIIYLLLLIAYVGIFLRQRCADEQTLFWIFDLYQSLEFISHNVHTGQWLKPWFRVWIWQPLRALVLLG